MLDALPHIFKACSAGPDLVDLVDVNDATLGCIQIAVGCLNQSGEQTLNVLADISSFRQARRISDDKQDVQEGSQRFYEMGFAASARADEQDVTFFDDDIPKISVGDDRIRIVSVPSIDEAFEVIRDGKGDPSLCDILTDDEPIEMANEGFWGWY
jgi:hypothetical protein